MSKRLTAESPPATKGTEVGALLSKLLDPRRQAFAEIPADNEDWLGFLEAARKVFAHKPNKYARDLLKMPIDTHPTAQRLVEALIHEIDEIKRKGPARDPVQRQRLRMALLIEDGLTRIRDELTLGKWTTKILKTADKVTSVKRIQNGAKREKGPDRTKQRWAAAQIKTLHHAKPDISVTEIARALHAATRKEKHDWWLNAKTLRVWLYRHKLLPKQDKMVRASKRCTRV